MIIPGEVGETRPPGEELPHRAVGRDSKAHPAFCIIVGGAPEHPPKVLNVFGQEFPAAFPPGHRDKERAARNQGLNLVRCK